MRNVIILVLLFFGTICHAESEEQRLHREVDAWSADRANAGVFSTQFDFMKSSLAKGVPWETVRDQAILDYNWLIDHKHVGNIPLISESGSYYGDPNDDGIAKTEYVHGYFRFDGTYVRSYFRAPALETEGQRQDEETLSNFAGQLNATREWQLSHQKP